MRFEDLQIIWIGKFNYKPGWIVGRHIHTFFHMLYIVGGKGNLTVNSDRYPLEGGQLYICPPRFEHGFTSDEENPLKTIEVKFSMKDETPLDDILKASKKVPVDTANIKYILEDSIDEALKKDYLYTEKIKTNIYTILIEVFRRREDKISKKQNFSRNVLSDCSYKGINFMPMLRYMENNLDKRITLNGLAKLAAANPNYLCRIFKEKYGIAPIQYLNNLRLKKAKELLAFSELNVTQIADILGFRTIHYFSRFFKDKEKMSPLEYRGKMNNTVFVDLLGGQNSSM